MSLPNDLTPVQPLPAVMRADLHSTRQQMAQGRTTASREMELSLQLAQSSTNQHTFLRLDADEARAAAAAFESMQAGAALGSTPHTASFDKPHQVLAGLAVSVKDLFDVTGQVTSAGSRVLAQAAPATADCPAVARLKAAGAALLGRTNMVEFAFSGVGTNPHYGTPVNPCDAQVARIPGGSSSGAAVSVATGAAFIGLGSDTGGSLRIPAALCGVVGFKPTARTVPAAGTVPLSTTLDTVGALTRSVRDAITAHEVLSGSRVPAKSIDVRGIKLAVACTVMLDNLDSTVARAFERSVRQLRAAGAQIDEIDLHEISDLGAVQARGGFSGAEAQAWQRARGLWPAQRAAYDPRVAQRLALADSMSAADYVSLQLARQQWIDRMDSALAPYAAVLSPTVPIVAAPIASLAPAQSADAAQTSGLDTAQASGLEAAQNAARDAEFWRVNNLLLRNTSVVNMLDGCAISLPCHTPAELPVGLTLWHGAMHDHAVLQLALWAEACLAQVRL
jgi:aspartyl-tRNA(Asn)/glutamyl-tRNA(Gln) amidotransferase subunit A